MDVLGMDQFLELNRIFLLVENKVTSYAFLIENFSRSDPLSPKPIIQNLVKNRHIEK